MERLVGILLIIMFPLTWTCFLVILMNIQLLNSAEVQKVGHLHVGGGDGYLANLLHYVIKHEGSIKYLETKMEKHAEDIVKLENELENKHEYGKLELKHNEDMSKMKKIHADDLMKLQNNLEIKHDADINTLKKIHADDLVKLKKDLETKLANNVEKIERKHVEDMKKLMSDIEAVQKKTPSEACPSKLPVYWRGHCYGLFHITLTWQRAQEYCQSVGANLVWIEDEAEQKFVTFRFSPKKVRIWLGCNDITHEETFVWVHNNQRVSYSNWGPKQPSNSGGIEDCCEIGVRDIGLWNDLPCHYKIENFICKT